MGFFKYIKAAFANKWNILAFAGGMGFAVISGAPDVAVPIVLAAEVGYLGLLGTHEKFRKYVDAKEHKKAKATNSADAKKNLRTIMRHLSKKSKDRYRSLADRCQRLRKLSANLHSGDGSLEEQQMEGLDRLLWIFLKLLYTEHTLAEFLHSTDENHIVSEVTSRKHRIEHELSQPESEQRSRVLGTLRDDLETCEARLENYRKADQNYELIQLELQRLENKIQSLGEMAINRKEPDFVSDQVDEVAGSMLQTEKTLNELEFLTGIHTEQDEPVPELMRRRTTHTRN